MAFEKTEKKPKSGPSLSTLSAKMNYSANITFAPTGSVVLDAIMGGGMPEGGFIELCSPSAVGKSTTMLHMSRTMCDNSKKVLYMDVEGGVNPNSLNSFGLDGHLYEPNLNPDGNFILLNPSSYGDAEELMDYALEPKNGIGMVVIDSITFLLPTKRMESSVEGVQIAIDAVTMTNFFKKYNAECMRKKVTVWFVNQMRTSIDSRTGGNVKSAGGLALEHCCQVRIKLRKKQALLKTVETLVNKDSVPYGSIVTAEAFKNRFAPPNRKMDMAVYFGRGISNIYTYKEILQAKGFVKQGGAGYFTINLYDGEEPYKCRSLGQVESYLKDNFSQVQLIVDSMGGISIESSEERLSRVSKGGTAATVAPSETRLDTALEEGDEIEVVEDEQEGIE